jgi:hypothetical protein
MKQTKKDVQTAFQRFCEAYNLKNSATWNQETKTYSNDFIKLDYNPIYGGFRLDVVQQNTGERFFDGMNRRNTKEMLSYLQGLLAAKEARNFENIVK